MVVYFREGLFRWFISVGGGGLIPWGFISGGVHFRWSFFFRGGLFQGEFISVGAFFSVGVYFRGSSFPLELFFPLGFISMGVYFKFKFKLFQWRSISMGVYFGSVFFPWGFISLWGLLSRPTETHFKEPCCLKLVPSSYVVLDTK